jgi:hypothetical protein
VFHKKIADGPLMLSRIRKAGQLLITAAAFVSVSLVHCAAVFWDNVPSRFGSPLSDGADDLQGAEDFTYPRRKALPLSRAWGLRSLAMERNAFQ